MTEMLPLLTLFAGSVVLVFVLTGIVSHYFGVRAVYLLFAVYNTVMAVVELVAGWPLGLVAWSTGLALINWVMFFRTPPRNRRKRLIKAVGAKARLLLAKVIASMPQASPVTRPVPA